jgi:hypothetical protein
MTVFRNAALVVAILPIVAGCDTMIGKGVLVAAVAAVGICVGSDCKLPDNVSAISTRTVVGLDADPTHRSFDVAFNRSELAILPQSPNNGIPPVALMSSNDLGIWCSVTSQIMVTGAAANNIIGGTGPSQQKRNSTSPKFSPADTEKLIFIAGTSTTLGIKFSPEFDKDKTSSASGGAQGLSEISSTIGFKRREIIITPVRSPSNDAKPNDSTNGLHFEKSYPSAFSALWFDSKYLLPRSTYCDSTAQDVVKGDVSTMQYLATGYAADELAKNSKIKGFLGDPSTPAATQAAGTHKDNPVGRKIISTMHK